MLNLVLTHYWYDKILNGRKDIEYRAMSKKWTRDIWDKRDEIKQVRFQRAYSKVHIIREVVKIDRGSCPYTGWQGEYYRIHFK